MGDFDPREDEREMFAVEGFRVDVQHRIQAVMNRKGMSQRQLAERLGVSEARISQIFSPRSNMTVRFLARVFFALGDECRLESREWDAHKAEKYKAQLLNRGSDRWMAATGVVKGANDNAYRQVA